MKFRLILPGLYLLLALYFWRSFTRINHDGLANVGLMLATAPAAIVGLIIDAIIGSKNFSLLPTGHNYLTDHALYYVPAVVATVALFWLLGRTVDRRRS
ncbi:MAG: hypothetical protein ABIO43_01430 [Sphingomicrobium sp.]